MKPEIINVAPKYNTDKNSHGYIEHYAKHLPETASKILEIGVDKGQSILMWHEVYPEARIFGLDLFIENPIPFEADWVTWFKGNQADSKLLDEIRNHGPFDIIIDDGSHLSRHQLMTFYGLMGSTKLYVIEDLHCCEDEFWRQGLPGRLTFLNQLTFDRNFYYGVARFAGCEFELYDNKIAFIYAP